MKPEESQDLFVVSSSPHAHSGATITGIMLDVLIALAPATAVSCYFFGWHAIRLIGVCVATCCAVEWICRRLMKRENSLGDLSACVTGLLLALTLPPQLPTWMAVAGSAFAIAVSKQVFGGLGHNPFNPALAGRAFLLISCTGAMTTWSESPWIQHLKIWAKNLAEAHATPLADVSELTTATPLGFAKAAFKNGDQVGLLQVSWDFFRELLFGINLNGSLGETCAVALLLGGIYLIVRKVITWHIPVAFIGTVFVYAVILKLCAPETALPPIIHVFSGGLFLGAIFMATDMVTSPITKKGQLIFGLGCGMITMVIRTSKTGAYPEGVCFSILVMNAVVPLINRACRNRVFGTKLPKKQAVQA